MPNDASLVSVLVVCMGNICRSPMAEVVISSLALQHPGIVIAVESAGTHAHHTGHAADPRTQAYVARQISEGHSKLEAIRCLKRYIAREV